MPRQISVEYGAWGEEQRLTVEIRMADVHVVYALVGETGSDLLAFLLHLEAQWEESFDVGGWDIISVRALDERFPLEIEDGDQASHGCERRAVK